ncbi:MAG: RsiV family protein, partial [Terriglobia bacterium]
AQQIERIWASKFDIATRSIRKNHTGIRSYEISADYPQIKRARTRDRLRFNRWIRSKVMGYVREFEQLEQSAEISDRRRKLPPAHITEGLKLWYTVYYSDSRLISLRLTHSVMAIGQMHPIDYYETINYDIQRRAPLREHQVFKNGYAKVFSAYTREHVQVNYEMDYTRDDWLKKGTSPRRDNFSNWNIVPEGILIAFEDYQIASHSFGQLELIIPYPELKAVLRRGAATSRFLH